MIIFGYDEAKTYHDGKWVMFGPTQTADQYLWRLKI